MKEKPLIVFGTGQQAEIISFYLKKMSKKIYAYCVDDDHLTKEKFQEKKVITTSNLLKNFKPKEYDLHIAISYSEMNLTRSKKYEFFKKKGYNLFSVINNQKLLNSNLRIGQNIVILDSFIQPYTKVGNNTFIWSGTVIGHHTVLGSHCWISSGVSIGGNCKINDYSFFGLNATIGHFVKIQSNCFIGSGSHITKNISKNTVIIESDSKKINFNPIKFLKINYFK